MSPSSPPARALALAVATAFAAVVSNLILLRPMGPTVQGTGLVAAGMLAVLGAPFLAWAGAAYARGEERLDADGKAAGGTVRVAAVGALVLSLPVVAGVLMGASSPLNTWLPMPTSGALFWVRAGLALPAVALGLALGGGLVLVERPAVLIPALLVALVADGVMAWWWMARGIGGPGLELAGVGMGCTVGALIAAVTVGTSALAAGRARTILALHQPTPFPLREGIALARAVAWPAAVAVITAVAVATMALTTVGAGDGAAVAVIGPLAAVGVVVAGGEGLLRTEAAGGARWLTVPVLAAAGIGLVAAPEACAAPFLEPLHAAELPPAAVRLVGVLAVIEAGVVSATRAGLLTLHPRPWVEAMWVLAPAAAAVVGLAALGRLGPTALPLALAVARVASLPWLRRP